VACWNIRGLNDPIKHREVKSLILKFKIACIGLLETIVRDVNKDRVARSISRGWKIVATHAQSLLGRIWVMWNPGVVQFMVLEILHQAIHGKMVFQGAGIYILFVYGSCDYIERMELWGNLINHSRRYVGKPWVILGNFNVSRWPTKYSGGRPVLSKAMEEFGECIKKREMEDLRQTWLFFSWSNKRAGQGAIAKKIDRVFGNWGL
ncbi:hypothetical protein CFOL_v3_12651, partial [Cephalotus follicularis]